MSIHGMQLPSQARLQKIYGAQQKNLGGACFYKTLEGNTTTSFQQAQFTKADQGLVSNVQKGLGTVLAQPTSTTSQGFEYTLRNIENPFHSKGTRLFNFNDQNFKKLAQESRFISNSPKKQMENEPPLVQDKFGNLKTDVEFYDIKGNSFKNTLIPTESAKAAFLSSSVEILQQKNVLKQLTDYEVNTNNKERGKSRSKARGYVRSGMILFNNINQQDTNPKISRFLRSETFEKLDNKASMFLQKQQSDLKRNNEALKHSDEIQKTIQLKTSYSPDFTLKKFNNYDNTIRNAERIVLENYDIKKQFDLKDNQNQVSLGSSMGPGNRAILYSLVPKETRNNTQLSDKLSFRESQTSKLKQWNHFDSNISNLLNIEKKILASKNYELDSRANSIKNYGFQPLCGEILSKQRAIQNIVMETKKEPNDQLYKKLYTPITTYAKSLHDCRITNQQGKINNLRPNLNFS